MLTRYESRRRLSRPVRFCGARGTRLLQNRRLPRSFLLPPARRRLGLGYKHQMSLEHIKGNQIEIAYLSMG